MQKLLEGGYDGAPPAPAQAAHPSTVVEMAPEDYERSRTAALAVRQKMGLASRQSDDRGEG
jgi:hypothetical protein